MLLSPRLNVPRHIASLPLLVLLVVLLVLLIVLLPVRASIFPFPSWRNISLFQVIKMHLAAPPSHVGQHYACPHYSQPQVLRSQLDLNKIKFYEDVSAKLADVTQGEEWKQYFRPALNRDNKVDLLHLYAVLQGALKSASVQHILIHGSAVGAWRHRGVTPWDDDLDIAISVRDWVATKMALSCIEGFQLDVSSNSKWSFYRSDGWLIQGHTNQKRWPFIDIYLYTQDESYVWSLNYVHFRKFVFPVTDMFPVQFVPFECFQVPVPHNLKRVLQHQYVQPEVCVSLHSDHKTDHQLRTVAVPCTELTDVYEMHLTT